MAKSSKVASLVTPAGVARFPWLNKPKTKIGTKELDTPQYGVNLVLTPEQAKPIIDMIAPMTDAAFEHYFSQAKAKDKKTLHKGYPWEDEYDDQDAPTGNLVFKFGCAAEYKGKDGEVHERAPGLFDVSGKRLDASEKAVFGGSVIKVNYRPGPMIHRESGDIPGYVVAATGRVGVKLYLNNVQVIRFADGADDNPFGDESGGTGRDAMNDAPDDDDIPF